MKNERHYGWDDHGESTYGGVGDRVSARLETAVKYGFAFVTGLLTTQ